MESYKVKNDTEVPQIVINEPNSSDARLLFANYSSSDSETTAVMTYTYQSVILKERFPNIANVIEQISMVEMQHHELLAQMICKLGSLPVLSYGNRFWSASCINYTTDVRKVLLNDIKAEEGAIKKYENTILNLCNPCAIEIVTYILSEEQLHLQTLKKLLYNDL